MEIRRTIFIWISSLYLCVDFTSHSQRQRAIRRPDLCVFLDLTTDQALSRIAVRGIEAEIYEKRETLSLFRDTFLRILRTLPDSVAVVDASGSVDEVAAAVRAAVKRRLFI